MSKTLAGLCCTLSLLALGLAPAKAQVVGIHVIEVRWNLPLDAVMEQELDRGEELLESAKKVADQAGIELETELLQARDAAAAPDCAAAPTLSSSAPSCRRGLNRRAQSLPRPERRS